MANPYYTFSPQFIAGTVVRSEAVNTQYSAVEAGFDLLPSVGDAVVRGVTYLGIESGSGNTYTITMPDARTSYQEGDRVAFRATHTNTGSAVLNVDGLGAVTCVRTDDTALESGDIISGVYYEFIYDSAQNHFQMLNLPGSWITDMDNRVDWAEEWATNPEDTLISTAAGGNGIDDYSALHHAAKSATSAANAATTYDLFDDRYLGAKAADPTLDNDGDALLVGAMYYNTVSLQSRVYNGTTWDPVPGLVNIVEDTTPQLGGNLEANGFYFRATDGGSGLCSYGFENDANLGMYRVANDRLGFAAGGGQKLEVGTSYVRVLDQLRLTDGTVADLACSFNNTQTTGFFKDTASLTVVSEGDEVMKFTSPGSAVNYFEASASITNNAVELESVGTDTDVDIDIKPKGAGQLQYNGDEVATLESAPARKNMLINGSTQVWQLGHSGVITNNQKLADCWRAVVIGVGRFNAAPALFAGPEAASQGATSEIATTVQTADTSLTSTDLYGIALHAEGIEVRRGSFGGANAKTLTLTFLALHTVTGTYCVSIHNAANNRVYIAEYECTASNIRERHEVTFTADSSGTWLADANTTGLVITFCFGAASLYNGTVNAWQSSAARCTSNQTNGMSLATNLNRIGGVGLCVGPNYGHYDQPTFVEELKMCKRYYEQSFDYRVAPSDGQQGNGMAGPIYLTGAGTGYGNARPFETEKMNTTYTVTFYRGITGTVAARIPFFRAGWASPTANPAVYRKHPTGFMFTQTGITGGLAYEALLCDFNFTADCWLT